MAADDIALSRDESAPDKSGAQADFIDAAEKNP